MELWDHQRDALAKLHNGAVLVGGTGSGKTLTSLAYFKKVVESALNPPTILYVITTAKKRDEGDWIKEATKIGISNIHVDSWHNIKKYIKVKEAFFIFDEQRIVGYGKWAKTFLRISKYNRWILLSATPADTWMDLISIFIANGYFRNKTDFTQQHVIYAPHVKYPMVIGYRHEKILERYKNQIFVVMPDQRHTQRHILKIPVDYNEQLVKEVLKTEWNIFANKPIDSLAEEVFVITRIINSHPSRIFRLMEIQEAVKRLIIFYNYNFELEILRTWFDYRTTVAQYNGFVHQPLPTVDDWVYLVQYNSGSEAWECFTTNHMAYYSLSYSYRTRTQTRGRIDRHNTPYTDLYYYELHSESILDRAIDKAYSNKKNFNIRMLKLDPRKSQRL